MYVHRISTYIYIYIFFFFLEGGGGCSCKRAPWNDNVTFAAVTNRDAVLQQHFTVKVKTQIGNRYYSAAATLELRQQPLMIRNRVEPLERDDRIQS